jgi:hypothetical protein
MDIHTKNYILQNCNSQSIETLIGIIKSKSITIDELKEAGLDDTKLQSILNTIVSAEVQIEKQSEKEKFLNLIAKGRTKADEIIYKLSQGFISVDDLEDLKDSGAISSKIIRALRYSQANTDNFTPFRDVTQLPPMETGRTDLYFIGVPGSGKSTMLSGILYKAHKSGTLLPDPYNQDGVKFQNKLLQDFNNGVLPKATAAGSYNYIALSLRGEDEKSHPFNIVDVPGEVFNQIVDNPKVDDFLHYIHNSNRKIIVFVIDSLAHDNGYSDFRNQNDQSLIYPNILQLLHTNGVLEQTDAIYLVANKFDAIYQNKYQGDSREHKEIALEFLSDEFLNLINNCKAVREESKNKFKIKILPFSIGKVAFETIFDSYEQTYSTNILNEIIADSFVVKGGKWTKLFS